jgi:hypothetical protein
VKGTRRAAALVAAAGALVLVPGAVAAKPPVKLPRPTEGGLFAFKAKEATPVQMQHAVVHYARAGVNAPPKADANGNKVPDYVEAVGKAADEALGAFVAFGFKHVLPDSGGGNAKVDIYLRSLPRGLLGVSIPHTRAVGGAFVVISTKLDPREGVKSGLGLRHTVAHELFHIEQYSYVPDGQMPGWAAEGMAEAVSIYTFPQSQDKLGDFAVDLWLKTPWLSLYDQRVGCARCYGGAIWWRFLYQLRGRLLPAYMGRLYGYEKIHKPILDGTAPLTEMLQKAGKGSLWDNFTRFSINLYRGGFQPKPLYGLRALAKPQLTKIRAVNGLSTHYIPIAVPAGATKLRVAIATGGGPRPNVQLVTGGPKGRAFTGGTLKVINGKSFEFTFKNEAERKSNMLIVTSGRRDPVAYQIAYQAV